MTITLGIAINGKRFIISNDSQYGYSQKKAKVVKESFISKIKRKVAEVAVLLMPIPSYGVA